MKIVSMKKLGAYVKRGAAAALAAALLFALAGCGKEEQAGQDPEWVYVPEFLELQDADEVSWYDSAIRGEELYAFSHSYDETAQKSVTALVHWPLQGGTPEKVTLDLPENAGIQTWCLGEDGKLYAALSTWTMNEDGSGGTETWQYAVFDDQGKLLSSQDISSLFEDEYSYLAAMTVDSQGRIYILSQQGVILLDEQGTERGTVALPPDSYADSMDTGLDGKVYVDVTTYGGEESSTTLLPIDFDTKSFGEGYGNYPSGSGNGGLVQDSSGKFLAQDGTKVIAYDPDTQESEELFQWLDCDINGSSVQCMGCLEDGRIAVVYQDWDTRESGAALLTKTAYAEVPHKTQIVVASVYGTGSDLQAAAVNFNKNNDQYHVTVRSYMDSYGQWSEELWQDAIKRLNSDITSNNCPDLIDLSSVDMAQLAAKGAFEDLNPFLDQSSVLSREDMIENVLNAYTFDGKLTAIPTSFDMRTVIGSSEEVGDEMGWSLEEMIAFADAHPGAELFDRTSKDRIMQCCLTYNMDVFLDWSTGECSFDSDEFKKLLEFVNRFPDQDSITYNEGDPSEAMRIQNGQVLLTEASIFDLEEIQLYKAMFQGPVTCIGYPSADNSSGCVLDGIGTYAITSKSKVKDGAWAFLESYYTLCQDSQMYSWGLPNSKSKLEEMKKEALEVVYVTDENGEVVLDENGEPMVQGTGHGVGYGDWEYDYRKPTEEEVDTIFQLMEVARPVSGSDEMILNIINEEAAPFYQGQKSVDEVSSIIQSRVRNYVDENR